LAQDQEQRSPAPYDSSAPLVDIYRSMFEALPATTPELLRQVYGLRYQVYCLETGFEDPAASPDGLETDEYDNHSLHGLLLHRRSRMPAGTIRVVLPELGRHSGRLPIRKVCRDPRLRDPGFLPERSTAELSRFAISKAFRQRLGDELYGSVHQDNKLRDSRIIPHISLGLMAVALQMTQGHGIEYICAVMEPALLRLLGRLGIRFTPIGPLVDYHGKRQPCFAEIDTLLSTIERDRHDVWEVVTDRGLYWSERRPRRRDAEDRPGVGG
jgi:N-acyl amino acid synthase of PEP-CTERM/exosortase system